MKVKSLILTSILIFGGHIAQAKEIPNLAAEVKLRLEKSESSANSWLQSLGTTEEVCEYYDQAVKELYWLDKGAKNLVLIGKSGIEFCFSQAKKLEQEDKQKYLNILAYTKTIAYNVAANAWPGWGDEGITITQAEMNVGLEAAELNLKLAFDLNKPNDKIANAFWLLSALQLSLKMYKQSLDSIKNSDLYASKTDDLLTLYYNESFQGIILIASGLSDVGITMYNSGLSKLKALNAESTSSYIGQLETAKMIFTN